MEDPTRPYMFLLNDLIGVGEGAGRRGHAPGELKVIQTHGKFEASRRLGQADAKSLRSNRRNLEGLMSQLSSVLTVHSEARGVAEIPSIGRFTPPSDIERELSETMTAKNIAGRFPFEHHARFIALEAQLMVTQKTQEDAGRVAFEYFSGIVQLEERLLATQQAKEQTEALAIDKDTEIDALLADLKRIKGHSRS